MAAYDNLLANVPTHLWIGGKWKKSSDNARFDLCPDPAAPFGGMKQSGIGREGAHDGLKEFLETQHISTSW